MSAKKWNPKMTELEIKTTELNNLISNGETLKAIELFYSDNVSMQENEEIPRVGKRKCWDNEQQNLKNIKELKCKLLNQAINNKENLVFSEWEITITDKNDKKNRLTEVSVQHWGKGQIEKEKFYYKGFHAEI
ncbi:hypothetical protein [Cytophaga aurantiaca]|uniref:hypothetical protein n=1 Tax=Cytophaga aurantiaca TaxID=29530 RepID=UPI00037D1E44|nr:hypothetical protein [Cytophaga aurantiaca]